MTTMEYEPKSAHSQRADKPALYCISFDGVLMSGIVEESLKLAYQFYKRGFRVLLDLGFDIKARKEYFGRSYTDDDAAMLPSWVELTRIDGLLALPGYHRDMILELIERCIKAAPGTAPPALLHSIDVLADAIAQKLVRQWTKLGVRVVLVENGTIPENIIYTEALWRAIEQFGAMNNLDTYVIWRDHDVMWFYAHNRYGPPPYAGIPKPRLSPYIHYVTTTSDAQERLSGWAPDIAYHVLPFFHTVSRENRTAANASFRSDFSIGAQDFLIARCSRIIPEKRIDRDIHLIAGLNERWRSDGSNRRACLFITGYQDEDPATTRSLLELAGSLGVEECLRFGDGLLSFERFLTTSVAAADRKYSVRDLLAHADMSSFLTSYRFEGYGLPPGEAIACGVPYISSSYELYGSVYGEKGFRAPLLPVSLAHDTIPAPVFFDEVYSWCSTGESHAYADHNFQLGRSLLSIDNFQPILDRLLNTGTTSSR